MLVADLFIMIVVFGGILLAAWMLSPVVGFVFELVEDKLRGTDSGNDLREELAMYEERYSSWDDEPRSCY